MDKIFYADIILPLAVRGKFTYRIPQCMIGGIKPGVRVMVQFGGKNQYAAIVSRVHEQTPIISNVKDILKILDTIPVINELQLKLWQWISEYYLCTEGEVLKAALPSGTSLSDYRARLETFIRFSRNFTEQELHEILDNLRRAPGQYEMLSAYIRISGYNSKNDAFPVLKSQLQSETHSSSGKIEALIKKGILVSGLRPVSRIQNTGGITEPLNSLSDAQRSAYESISSQFKEKDIVLLHGVTSSGKTELYIHLIEEQLKMGKQVLYMLPEIALTTQIITRLRKHFGEKTGVYHSRFNDNEKVEIWKKVSATDTPGYHNA
jgi:primosomal protein N' (replication factor Y)